MAEPITRRRAITILAASAGLPLLSPASRAMATIDPTVWKGQALGASATLVLNHPDRAKAEELIRRVMREVDRLESIFSLYRPGSSLNELNRTGALVAPPPELVALLKTCREFWETTGHRFDPTIQPLWALYARHFAGADANTSGPAPQEVKAAAALVGFDGVRCNRDRITFARRGMALTLNGVAQGYITDRVVELLRKEGVTSSLVNMGEIRAIGAHTDDSPWRVGLGETDHDANTHTTAAIVDMAVATSSPSGFHFDAARRFSHLIDPRTGSSPRLYSRLSVVAPDATTADALSTALILTDPSGLRSFMNTRTDLAIDLTTTDGQHLRIDNLAAFRLSAARPGTEP